MPKNKGKGGKNRRRGKNENEGLKRELVFKEDGQEYAQVLSKVTNVSCICPICHIIVFLNPMTISGDQNAG